MSSDQPDPPFLVRCVIGPGCADYLLLPWREGRDPRQVAGLLASQGWSLAQLDLPHHGRAQGPACPLCTRQLLAADEIAAAVRTRSH